MNLSNNAYNRSRLATTLCKILVKLISTSSSRAGPLEARPPRGRADRPPHTTCNRTCGQNELVSSTLTPNYKAVSRTGRI